MPAIKQVALERRPPQPEPLSQRDRVFGLGRKKYGITGAHDGLNAEHHLFAADTKLIQPKPPEGQKQDARRGRRPPTQVRYYWSRGLPFYARAMLLAGETLFVAGPEDVLDFAAESPKGDVWLWSVSAADGATRAEYKLKAAPVFDSLAAAAGRLYLTTVDGRVVVLKYPEDSRHAALLAKMSASPDQDFATTAVTVEEQMRGWLALIHRSVGVHQQVPAYRRLVELFGFFSHWNIVQFNEPAADEFKRLRRQGIRIASMDLKIATIALVHDGLLLSANLRDFAQVPGLRVEDWMR